MNAIEEYISPTDYWEFAKGYIEVCKTISNWWENLNTLCLRCNVKINRERDYWTNYFISS